MSIQHDRLSERHCGPGRAVGQRRRVGGLLAPQVPTDHLPRVLSRARRVRLDRARGGDARRLVHGRAPRAPRPPLPPRPVHSLCRAHQLANLGLHIGRRGARSPRLHHVSAAQGLPFEQPRLPARCLSPHRRSQHSRLHARRHVRQRLCQR